jgi:DNA-binding transcriptional ArsR family regulator
VSDRGRREAKDALFDALASVARALGNGRRAEIVDVLAQGERSVEVVAGEIGQSIANTSHHLRALASAGLLTSRREGKRIIYHLAGEHVGELWTALRDVAADHVETLEVAAAAYLGDRGDIQAITADELADRLARGRVVLLDARPSAEYAAGHIPGAWSAPIDVLDDLLQSLPDHSEVVAYCRGPYCIYADQAVRLLQGHGRPARRLDVGLPEWRRAGRPVESETGEAVPACHVTPRGQW